MSASAPGTARARAGAEPGAAPGIAYVGLGANLGDARAAIERGLAAIASLPGTRVESVSRLYRTAPVDASGPDFVNAVARLRTTLDPHALLQALLRIERAEGRQRPYRNAPRTLDLDLLTWDALELNTPDLVLPHPRMHERAFVLAPLAELAPELQIPGHGPVAACLERCRDQAVEPLPDRAAGAAPRDGGAP